MSAVFIGVAAGRRYPIATDVDLINTTAAIGRISLLDSRGGWEWFWKQGGESGKG